MRRAFLALFLAATVGACSSGGESTTGTTATKPPRPGTTTTTAPRRGLDATTALRRARDPQSPQALARVIRAAEHAVADRRTPAADLAAWGAVHQLAYRQLARRPEWDAPVATALPPRLDPEAAANALAFRELWSLTEPRDELPEWRIVAPPPPRTLLRHYRAAEAELAVPWEYLAAIHLVESRMGRIRGPSSAGARGPMQFLPSTWEAYGEGDIEDPADAIAAAARYLVANGAPGDMEAALFAYNHSDHYVRAVTAHASVMAADERAYLAYYHWQVYYRLATGDVVLPVGWRAGDPPQPA